MERCDYDFMMEEKRQDLADYHHECEMFKIRMHAEDRFYDENNVALDYIYDIVQECKEMYVNENGVIFTELTDKEALDVVLDVVRKRLETMI